MVSASPLAENHDSRAIDVLVPTILTTVVAFILTGLRLYVRRFVMRMFGWDDVFNVLALLCAIVVMGLVVASTKYGLGRHFLSLDPVRAAYCVKLLRISEFFLIFSTIFLKISISLFLKRLLLEATLGVIAAAAPSVRPLIGHNSMSTEYSRSKSRQISQSLPLHSMRTGRSSRHGVIDSMLDTMDDRGKESDGDSQSHLWAAPDEHGIMKTMSVEVVTTQGQGSDGEPPTPTNWPLEALPTNGTRRAPSPHSPRVEEHRQV
ncbi:hypothetical protein N7510_000788 [Penicillium lagena]|uniref:uncharacterized protein n=1 Tax=Penicillium lagena TaxID=94218 RepID=UPI0025413E50|nr:uncharacterized protein N7510_000788 [Penicillium lagena]KAJ5624479.1 hypothetical protein N7510_000788 [Penicillium lagena]